MKNKKSILIMVLALFLSIGTISVFANNESSETKQTEKSQEQTKDKAATTKSSTSAKKGNNPKGGKQAEPAALPDETTFKEVVDNKDFTLKADKETGHFVVTNKKTGDVLRSFPDPAGWGMEGTSPVWQSHLRSPLMFTYVEFNVRKDIVKESNFLSQGGSVDFQEIEGGFQITYDMPKIGFTIPVEVRLKDDYVETKVLADQIKDELEVEKGDKNTKKDPKSRLVSLRLFPFLGASSSDQEGYLFLPDGPGVLVDFKKNRASTNNLYSERVYGDDWSFLSNNNASARLPVRMPVFGIKAGQQAVLGVIQEGDSYANIVSAPSQSLSQYNWVTAEHSFRFKFHQPTNRKNLDGFFTYSEEMQRKDRITRYYMIQEENPDYVDMAQRYRQYLIEDVGVERLQSENENINLQLNLIGGGTKSGFLRDSFLSLTTAEQAAQIVKELSSSGVEDMTITYHGWQHGGYEKFGGHYPIAGKLGGNDGMREFIDFSHSKGFPVYFEASSYTFNDTGKDGFRPKRDGLRDLSSTVFGDGDFTFVSPEFMQKTIYKDFDKVKELNIDGYLYGEGIGSVLATDYNERYEAKRHEVKEIQAEIIEKTRKTLGDVQVSRGNFYTLKDVSHMSEMDSDFSYDLFVDRKIPFAQIALHGLVSYSFDYGNMGGASEQSLLEGIEYGAIPSFILTFEHSQKLLESKSMRRFYSTYYKDWETEIAAQYQRYNEALGDVQDQFIVGHRKLAEGVFETTYEQGKKIIVNYNNRPYSNQDISVEAEDFAIVEGGK